MYFGYRRYSTTDASFGNFAVCYGDTPALGSISIVDDCGFLWVDGVDQYGDSYTYTITNSCGVATADVGTPSGNETIIIDGSDSVIKWHGDGSYVA